MSIPLSKFPILRTTDPEECLAVVSRHLGPHGFQRTDRDSPFRAVQNFANLTTSAITYLYYGACVDVISAVIERSYLVVAPLSGRVRLLSEGRELLLCKGRGAVLSPNRAFTIRTESPASSLMWKIERSSLERHVAALIGRELGEPVQFRQEFDWLSGKPGSFFRSMCYVAGELDSAIGTGTSRFVKENMEQLLIRVLLDSQPNNVQDYPEYKGTSIAPRCVRRVESYVDAHLSEHLTALDLTRASGVSSRTMYSSFKQFRGISPMAHLRNARMKKVRDDLVRSDGDASVTDILMRRGVSQLGRFAVEYKRRYGESPSETLRRRGIER